MRIIDISMTTDADPAFAGDRVTFVDHAQGAERNRIEAGIDPDHWPTPGHSHAIDRLEITSHTGTHMDAPWHFGPRMADGSRPLTIEEWPLSRCMGDGVVLDISDVDDGAEVDLHHVQRLLREIDYAIKPGDVVLTMTGADRHYGTPGYADRGAGLSRAALKWILEQGVTLVGTDAWSFDRPYSVWAAEYHRHGKDPQYLWPCHLLGLELPYAHIEKLANLDQLPPHGFTVIAFPVKIVNGTAGPVRAVALVQE
ncbi:cyclase family protein [Conexibacter woesei]|uniref:Cyclase family protein n=1 Tax=Conexibacter woesei (strain DSM 14684 / CCUG 47730 / CIP 108061 / JCM 11494 / NBRC 100937 / ID131577) TaxID=469383 RepID=D3F6L8_CONWI|nr:cyclase family protein [Conexibacter woesei]ADB50785.1 cyclase family protein [Conexibacter woesei DSM 14684]